MKSLRKKKVGLDLNALQTENKEKLKNFYRSLSLEELKKLRSTGDTSFLNDTSQEILREYHKTNEDIKRISKLRKEWNQEKQEMNTLEILGDKMNHFNITEPKPQYTLNPLKTLTPLLKHVKSGFKKSTIGKALGDNSPTDVAIKLLDTTSRAAALVPSAGNRIQNQIIPSRREAAADFAKERPFFDDIKNVFTGDRFGVDVWKQADTMDPEAQTGIVEGIAKDILLNFGLLGGIKGLTKTPSSIIQKSTGKTIPLKPKKEMLPDPAKKLLNKVLTQKDKLDQKILSPFKKIGDLAFKEGVRKFDTQPIVWAGKKEANVPKHLFDVIDENPHLKTTKGEDFAAGIIHTKENVIPALLQSMEDFMTTAPKKTQTGNLRKVGKETIDALIKKRNTLSPQSTQYNQHNQAIEVIRNYTRGSDPLPKKIKGNILADVPNLNKEALIKQKNISKDNFQSLIKQSQVDNKIYKQIIKDPRVDKKFREFVKMRVDELQGNFPTKANEGVFTPKQLLKEKKAPKMSLDKTTQETLNKEFAQLSPQIKEIKKLDVAKAITPKVVKDTDIPPKTQMLYNDFAERLQKRQVKPIENVTSAKGLRKLYSADKRVKTLNQMTVSASKELAKTGKQSSIIKNIAEEVKKISGKDVDLNSKEIKSLADEFISTKEKGLKMNLPDFIASKGFKDIDNIPYKDLVDEIKTLDKSIQSPDDFLSIGHAGLQKIANSLKGDPSKGIPKQDITPQLKKFSRQMKDHRDELLTRTAKVKLKTPAQRQTLINNIESTLKEKLSTVNPKYRRKLRKHIKLSKPIKDAILEGDLKKANDIMNQYWQAFNRSYDNILKHYKTVDETKRVYAGTGAALGLKGHEIVLLRSAPAYYGHIMRLIGNTITDVSGQKALLDGAYLTGIKEFIKKVDKQTKEIEKGNIK